MTPEEAALLARQVPSGPPLRTHGPQLVLVSEVAPRDGQLAQLRVTCNGRTVSVPRSRGAGDPFLLAAAHMLGLPIQLLRPFAGTCGTRRWYVVPPDDWLPPLEWTPPHNAP